MAESGQDAQLTPTAKIPLAEATPGVNETPQQSTPTKPGFIQKPPQELAAQIESVSSIFYAKNGPVQERLNEGYKTTRQQIEQLLEQGVGDDVLAKELDKIYKEGGNDGAYKPTEGENAQDLIAMETQRLMGFGYSSEEAEAQAIKDLSREGFVGELRNWRKRYEEDINRNFTDYNKSHPLSPAEETERISRLREGVIDLSDPEQRSQLAESFPGGNFLYHGTEVKQAVSILDSGDLANTTALINRERARSAAEGRKPDIVKKNSGYEGISWNYGEIGAMPGDRYHLVGFLASPRDVLSETTQLAIPSRPAPHELILIDRGIDADRFYSLKSQQELIEGFSGMGETNSVLSNIIQLSSVRNLETNGSTDIESMLNTFSESELTDQVMGEKLGTMYSVRDNGTIELSTDLLQQVKNDVPVAAVWFQALIDTGRMKNVPGFEDVTSVRQAIERINGDNSRNFFDELKKDGRFLKEAIQTEDEKVGELTVPISDMYFVIPDTDLDKWLTVLARAGTQPKGIVTYDHNLVRLENFASMHRGDNQALTDVLQSAIPASDGYIDYESQLLGEEITPDKMVGYRKHVVAEKYLGKRKTLKKGPDGNLAVR